MLDKKFLNFRPFFFTAISIALGVGAGYLFYFSKILLGILLTFIFLLFVAVTVLFTGGEVKKKLYFAIAFIVLFSFGAGAFSCQVNRYETADLNGHYYSVTGKVTWASKIDNGQKLTLEDVSIVGNRKGNLKYNVCLYVYGESSFDIGDVLEFESYLTDNGAKYEQRLSATNIERGIKYTANLDAEQITLKGKDLNLFERIHVCIRNILYENMDENEGAIAYGMLLGNTDDMDGDVITAYRSAGVAHIFAVSGLHIGFLAFALNWFCNLIRLNRLAKAIIVTLILLFYSGVCGFSASSLRASVMSAVLLFSSIKGNRYDGLSSVGFACALILFCSPINMFCVGFQLSFGVVLGIILLSPPLKRLFSFLPQKLANSLSTVLAAQIVGIPICLYAFGQFSTIAIIANLIFIPIVGAIFVFLIVAIIVGGLCGISNITLFIPNYMLKGINFLITAIDYEIFLVGGFTFGIFALFYYLALVLPCGLIGFNKITKLIVSLVCVLTCVIGTVVANVVDNSTPKAYVIGSEKVCSTVIKTRDENIMIVSDADRILSVSKFNRLKLRQDIDKIDTLVFTQGHSVDIQVFLTRFKEVLDVDRVCYYGYTNSAMEETVRKSFGIKIKSFNQGDRLTENSDCYYALNGYAVICNVNGNRLAVFSEFGSDKAGYMGLDGEFDYIIATDYARFICEEYNPERMISYRSSELYESAHKQGTLTLRLK